MSPQREGESQEMYLYRLEMTQERQEEAISRTNEEVSSVRAIAVNARELATQTHNLVTSMPQKIIEAIEERDARKRKENKLDSREKLILAMGILGTLGGIAGAVASIKQAFGG